MITTNSPRTQWPYILKVIDRAIKDLKAGDTTPRDYWSRVAEIIDMTASDRRYKIQVLASTGHCSAIITYHGTKWYYYELNGVIELERLTR